MERPSWHEYFMGICDLVATRSTCLRRSVGAVLVKEKRILCTGYNGAPTNIPHCSETGCLRKKMNVPSGEKHELCRGVHAEQNAIIQGDYTRMQGSTLYLAGYDPKIEQVDFREPCSMCKRAILNAGITEVVCRTDFDSYEVIPVKRWTIEDDSIITTVNI